MRKKSYASRLGVLAVALTLVTTCLVGGTMAKYTTTAEGTGSGTVAKFDVGIQVNGKDLAKSAVEIPNLFTTGREAGNGTNVVENKLAPGTSGYFDLSVTNNSEVKINVSDVKVDVIAGSADIPMQFGVTGTDVISLPEKGFVKQDAIAAKIKAEFNNSIDWTANANSKTVRIWWQWAPGTTDAEHATDTALGTVADGAEAPTYGLNISVTADQVIATN